MDEFSIKVEQVSKYYRMRTGSEETSLRETLSGAPRRWWGRLRGGSGPRRSGDDQERFAALSEVSLAIAPGERWGFIGPNGAGKTTLLKILSRITPPSAGRVTIRGRLSSMLEVGTGFHPELTGRENIFLNGAILGMTTAEIRRKYDSIVEFSGVREFLNLPVKRYSSGMYVRLAFAVAVHFDPDILLVDEVLAVGDQQFQDKCLKKMGELSQDEHRTLLFVSHNLGAIKTLCTKAVLLERGVVRAMGAVDEVVNRYLLSINRGGGGIEQQGKEQHDLYFTDFWMEDAQGRRTTSTFTGDCVTFCAAYTARREFEFLYIALGVFTLYDVRVTAFSMVDHNMRVKAPPGAAVARCVVPRLPLTLGRYYINLSANDDLVTRALDMITQVFFFDVGDGDFFGKGAIQRDVITGTGPVLIPHAWEMVPGAGGGPFSGDGDAT